MAVELAGNKLESGVGMISVGKTAEKDQVIVAGVSDEDDDAEELVVTLVTILVMVIWVVD